MKILETNLPGILLFELPIYRDARGHFLETWNQDRHAAAGLQTPFVQDNLSLSRKGVLRGLHYQHPAGQGKLVSVPQGAVYDVVVDIRRGSPTFGQSFGAELSADNGLQMYIPPGFAHGFLVLSETAIFLYKCTEFYAPGNEGSIHWNDPDLAINWPLQSLAGEPILSPKDSSALRLAEVPATRLPSYE